MNKDILKSKKEIISLGEKEEPDFTKFTNKFVRNEKVKIPYNDGESDYYCEGIILKVGIKEHPFPEGIPAFKNMKRGLGYKVKVMEHDNYNFHIEPHYLTMAENEIEKI